MFYYIVTYYTTQAVENLSFFQCRDANDHCDRDRQVGGN